MEAHILVRFLALAQWRVLEQWMSSKGLGTCARKLITAISTIKSMEVIIPVKRGESSAELTERTVARPERCVAELLTRLDLELPTRNRILGESKIDFKAKCHRMKFEKQRLIMNVLLITMRHFHIILLGLTASILCSCTSSDIFNLSKKGTRISSVRTTAYTHGESDHIVYGAKTAVGTQLKYGNVRSAAADWSVYPVGTIFQIEGLPYVYQVDDYGSALVGTNTIDLYKPDKATMKAWGVRNVNIRVLKWGSFSKSLNIMKPRTGYSHIRRMVNRIEGST